MARAHIRIDACLRCESLSSTLRFNSSPPSAWLFGPHPSPQSKPVLDKSCCWKRRKSRRGRSWGDEAIFRRSKILHCSVYSALWLGGLRLSIQGDKPNWLLAVWQKKKKKKKHSVDPLKRRPTGKMPGMPDYQSSPASDMSWVFYSLCYN